MVEPGIASGWLKLCQIGLRLVQLDQVGLKLNKPRNFKLNQLRSLEYLTLLP